MPHLAEDEAFHELCAYTLSLRDAEFVHQNVVDAYAAQNADQATKPMKVAFALIGLYLTLEKEYTGREVQLAHMKMAKDRKHWPTFPLPSQRATISAADVMKYPPGAARQRAVREWCAAVWASWSNSHRAVAELAMVELGHEVDRKLRAARMNP